MSPLDMVLAHILEKCEPELVILYGAKSHVGSNEPKSLDFCVVTPFENKRALQKKLYLGIDTDIAFNILLYTPEQWGELVSDTDSYAHVIRSKGRIIYER